MTIDAHCKINLHLDVGPKRPDGFHSIDSIFVALGLCDTLDARRRDAPADGGGPFTLATDTSALPPELAAPFDPANLPPRQNLAWKAATLFAESYPLPYPVNLTLTKRIPAGAGLGGASSDAAATLIALNRLAGNPCPPRDLAGMAARLGSDAPFFLEAAAAMSGGRAASFWARARGRGEILTPLKPLLPSPFWAVLAHPGFFSATPRAYALLDAYRARRGHAAAAGAPAPPFFNSFLPVLLEEGPPEDRARLRGLLSGLAAHTPRAAGLSGSGSACFALFTDQSAAEAALRGLAPRWPWRVLTAG